jgi:small subunit ribosomal protein S5
VIQVNRCAKVVKGGRRFSFNAIVALGDQHGRVGVGLGKANEVADAIRKAGESAKKNMFHVPVTKSARSAPDHQQVGRARSCQAGEPGHRGHRRRWRARRARVAGIQNVLTKCLGPQPHNMCKATVDLKRLRRPRTYLHAGTHAPGDVRKADDQRVSSRSKGERRHSQGRPGRDRAPRWASGVAADRGYNDTPQIRA